MCACVKERETELCVSWGWVDLYVGTPISSDPFQWRITSGGTVAGVNFINVL